MIRRLNNKGNIGLVVLIFLVLVVVFITIVSNKLHQEVTEEEASRSAPAQAPAAPAAVPAAKTSSKASSSKIVRKTIVVRGNDFLEHWFYAGEEVIAKQRVSDQGVIDTEGEIPEGKVSFMDTYKNTTGEESYRKGVRDGPSTTYYADGKLKETARYESGKLLAKTEYYTDGRKRFEVDYSDSRDLGGDIETGIGKLYWPNGFLKFEWHLTRRDPIGYKKSYNQDGTLRHAAYFDEYNNRIEQAP